MAFADKNKANKYTNQWQAENKDRIILMVNKGDKDKIKAKAAKQSKSLNQYIIEKINAPD